MAKIDIRAEGKGMFLLTLATAKVGDEIIYHIGPHAGGFHKADAMRACGEGRCFLYQRRLTDKQFAYIAKKRK